jgi:uncharacterized protein (TIGR03435 family)
MTISVVAGFMLAHLWQSTLFAAGAWLLVSSLLRKNRPQVRYAVWLAASVKFLVPFAALNAIGKRMAWLRPRGAPQTNLPNVLDQVSQRLSIPPLVTKSVAAVRAPSVDYVPYVFVAVWVCGFLAVAAVCWVRARQVRGAALHAKPLRRYRDAEVFSSTAMQERALEPGVFGLWKRVVLVPEGISERLLPEEFESVLAHEYAHFRRRDNIAAVLQMTVEALFWFHPLVWWIGKQLLLERERACDDEVIRSGSDPAVYAQGILNVCKFYVESPMSCVPGVTGSDLKKRIEEIMQQRVAHDLTFLKRILLATAAVAAIAGPILFGLVHAHAQAPSSFTGLSTTAKKTFDVALIKENVSVSDGWSLGKPNRGSETIRNLDLHKIVASSFRVQDKMVFGPDWMDKVRYDITAKGPDPEASNPEVWEMMRSLLAERFHLQYHIETREMSAYVLSIAKGGAKYLKGDDGRCKEKIQAGDTNCGSIDFLPFGVGIVNTPIGGLTGALARTLQDRPIVDKTGLPDRYDMRVLWRPDNVDAAQLDEIMAKLPPELRPPDMNIFEAFEKQAGLKLEASKTGVQVVVVDRIERPTEN